MEPENRASLIGYLAVILAAAGWGTSGIFVKSIVASSGISALALAFLRDLFTFVVLVTALALFRPQWLRVQRRDLRWLLALGACLGVFHVVWNLGVLLNGAAVATVQQAVMPAIVAVAARLLWGEALTGRKLLAVALAFCGTLLVSGISGLGQVELPAAGVWAGIGIPIFYAAWNLLGKKVRQQQNPITALTFGFGFGALVLLPFQFLTVQTWPVHPAAWSSFGALVLVSTIVPFGVYIFALGKLPASVAGVLAMSEVPIVAVYAFFLLGERLSGWQLIGALLVVLGVLLLAEREQG